jgi:hypothetical protein
MKFVSALGWMMLGLCLGAILSRAIGGPYPVTGHAYAQQHAIAGADQELAASPVAAEVDSVPSN